MTPSGLLQRLAGGDRRSIGRVEEVIAAVRVRPSLFPVLVRGMVCEDPVVRMRAADAAEKLSAERPQLLRPHKRRLLRDVAAVEQQEVRWHLAQMVPRLRLTQRERAAAVELLTGYLRDQSRIVQVCALQALAELAQDDAALRPRVRRLLERGARSGSPAVRARARKLLRGVVRA